MTRVAAPPSSPPDVTVNGEVVDPLSLEWVIDGTLQTQYPKDSEGLEILAYVTPQAEVFYVAVASGTPPATISVSVFAEGVGDQPGATLEQIDCLDPGAACEFVVTDVESTIRLEVPDGAAAFVVSLEYSLEFADLEAIGGAISMDRVSFGWRVPTINTPEGD